VKLTEKQQAAIKLLADPQVKHLLMYGGAQSAKTFLGLYVILLRALKYPMSVHAICRLRLVDLKSAIMLTKFPEVCSMRLGKEMAENPKVIRFCYSYPGYVTFFNGSRIFFIGLEDNKGFDKILSPSYTTIMVDEASEVPYTAYSKLLTRLSQNNDAKKISICTLNPTTRRHWTYQLFCDQVNPTDRTPMKHKESYAYIQMNPADNSQNLPEDYLDMLGTLSASDRERFLHGNYSTDYVGSIYAREITEAEHDGHIVKNLKKVDDCDIYAVLDIGWADPTAVWFVQYTQDSCLFLEYQEHKCNSLVDILKYFPYNVKGIILPHDADHHWIGVGLSAKSILDRAAMMLPQKKRFWTKVLKPMKVWQGIHAARTLFRRCIFDEDKCSGGLQALKEYKTEYNEHLGVHKQQPKHDWTSHAADAFRYAIQGYEYHWKDKEEPKRDRNMIYFDDVVEGKENWT
jgi:hypothetical protein